jgi:hypothetical protein
MIIGRTSVKIMLIALPISYKLSRIEVVTFGALPNAMTAWTGSFFSKY